MPVDNQLTMNNTTDSQHQALKPAPFSGGSAVTAKTMGGRRKMRASKRKSAGKRKGKRGGSTLKMGGRKHKRSSGTRRK